MYVGNSTNYSLQGILPDSTIDTEFGIVVPVLFSVQTFGADFPYFEFSQMSEKALFFTKNILNKKKDGDSEMNINTNVSGKKENANINNNNNNELKLSIMEENKLNKMVVKNGSNQMNKNKNVSSETKNKITNHGLDDKKDKRNTKLIQETEFDPSPNNYFPKFSKNYNHINNSSTIQIGEKTETKLFGTKVSSTSTAILSKNSPILSGMSKTKKTLVTAVINGENINIEKRNNCIESVGRNNHFM